MEQNFYLLYCGLFDVVYSFIWLEHLYEKQYIKC